MTCSPFDFLGPAGPEGASSVTVEELYMLNQEKRREEGGGERHGHGGEGDGM